MLKTKTITTDKATLLVVELPTRDASLLGRMDENHWSYLSDIWGWGKFEIKGNWQLLGRLPDITEEQFEKIVEFGDQEPGNDKYILKWKDYELTDIGDECPYMDYSLDTASESFSSLLQANELYFENPYGEEPVGCSVEAYHTRPEWAEEWQEAQSKVCDRERTYLFIKVD